MQTAKSWIGRAIMVPAWAVVLTAVAAAQEAKPQAAVEVDLLKDAVDPYRSGAERARFLRTAGVDNELTEAERKAAAESQGSFVRSFDDWKLMKAFDRNDSGTLDWFEADRYRRSLRAALLKKYDADGNGRLAGDERVAANRALAEGKIPPLEDVGASTPAAGGGEPADREERRQRWRERRSERRREFIARFDADGDGELNEDERREAGVVMVMEGRERMVSKYDKNGDGLLDEAERAEVMQHRRDQWWLRMDDIGMKHFDANLDGRLSEQESRDLVAFGEKMQAMGKRMEVDFLDTDGDGAVSDAERQAMRQRMQVVGIQMMPKAVQWVDGNGDGRVDDAERRAIGQKFALAAQGKVKEWTDRFDSDGNGRLDPGERSELVEGIRADALDRRERHDADGDGQLNDQEMASMFEELAEEWGIKPPGT